MTSFPAQPFRPRAANFTSVPLLPESENSGLAEINQIIRAAGQLAGTTQQVFGRIEQQQEREREEDELYGRQLAREAMPLILNGIDKEPRGGPLDQRIVEADTEQLRGTIGELIQSVTPEGLTEAQARGFEQALLVPTTQQVLARRNRELQTMAAETSVEIEAASRTAMTADELQPFIEQYRAANPGAIDAEVVDATALNALRDAASLDETTERFDAIAPLAEGMFPTEVGRLRQSLESRLATQDARQQADADQGLANRVGRVLANRNEFNPELAHSLIDKAAEAGTVSGDELRRQRQLVESAEARRAARLSAQARADLEAVTEAAFQRKLDQMATADASKALNPALAADRPLDQLRDESHTIQLETGETRTLTGPEYVNTVIEQAFTQINQDYANDPHQALVQQMTFLADNGVTYEPWEAQLSSLHSRASNFVRRRENNEPVELTDGDKAAFALAQQMRTTHHELFNRHTSQDAQTFYMLADYLETYVHPNDARMALIEASSVRLQPGDRISSQAVSGYRPDRLKEDIEQAFKRDLKNFNEVRQGVVVIANFLQRGAGQAGAENAVKKAIKEVRSQYRINRNGYAIFTDNMRGFDGIDEIEPTIVESFLSDNPNEGYTEDDLYLGQYTPNEFYIADAAANGRPADPIRVFTRDELNRELAQVRRAMAIERGEQAKRDKIEFMEEENRRQFGIMRDIIRLQERMENADSRLANSYRAQQAQLQSQLSEQWVSRLNDTQAALRGSNEYQEEIVAQVARNQLRSAIELTNRMHSASDVIPSPDQTHVEGSFVVRSPRRGPVPTRSRRAELREQLDNLLDMMEPSAREAYDRAVGAN